MKTDQTNLRVPRTWEANLLVLAVVIIVWIGGAISTLFGLVMTMLVSQMFVILPALLWIAVRRLPLRTTLRFHPVNRRTAFWSALIGLACYPVVLGMSILFDQGLSLIGPGAPSPSPTGPVESLIFAVLYIILAPITEEPVFRGFVLGAWLRRGTVPGLVLSGFLFALYHSSLAGLVPLTLLGIVLALLAHRSNSIYASMIAHACYNTLGALFTIVPALREAPALPLMIAGALALPIALWLLWAFARRFPAPAEEPLPRESSPKVWGILSFLAVSGLILGLTLAVELSMRLSPNLVGP